MTEAARTGPADDPMPLTGLRVLVPRAPERAGAFLAALRRAGAEPVAAPLVEIAPPDDTAALDAALAALATGAYGWIAVTSSFTVDSLRARATQAGRDLAEVVRAGRAAGTGSTRVAAVGDATAGALRGAGVHVDFVPAAEQSARGMLAEWPDVPGPGGRSDGAAHLTRPADHARRADAGRQADAPRHTDPARARPTVLVPQGDLAEPTLADGLVELGFQPHVVVAYRNRPAAPLPPALLDELASGAINAVVLTSGSTARRLAAQVALPGSTLVCCIGPRTAEVAAELGLPTGCVADGPHPGAVVDALLRAVAQHGPPAPTPPR